MAKKRRKHTDAFKAKVALEALKGVRTMSELSSAYKVHPTVITKWKRLLMEYAAAAFVTGNGSSARSEDELTRPLYAEIGRLKMEVDWFKKKL